MGRCAIVVVALAGCGRIAFDSSSDARELAYCPEAQHVAADAW